MVLALPAYHFSPFAIPPAITAAIVMLLAGRIITTRYSPTTIAIFSMSVAAAAWQVGLAFTYSAVHERTAVIGARIGFAFMTFIAPAVYQFVGSIAQPAAHRRIVSRAAWIIAAQFAILTLVTGYIIVGVRRFPWGFYPVINPVALFAFLLFFCGVLALSAAEIYRARTSPDTIERQRVLLFTIALGIGCLALVDFLPLFGIGIYPLGWLALLGCTAVSVYTIAKYGWVPINPSLAANQIISTMRDLLFVSDRDGRIRFANNAAYAFLGYAREDIIGRRLEDLLVPTADADGTQPSRSSIRDREYVFRTKMGQPIELTLSHSPVTQQGEVTGAVIIGRDLRDRKRYEWEARRAVTLLESTLDSTADGILVIAQDGRVLTWNQQFLDLWRIPVELMDHDEDQELIGQLVEQLIDPAEFLSSLAAMHEHPEDESVFVLELKDGRRLEQYSIGRYLDDAPLRVWSFRDVTARLAAEEALKDSETRYRLLFEQNAAGVCLMSMSGRILDCNATFADMAGYSVDELIKHKTADVFEDPSAVENLRRRLDDTSTLRGLEIALRRKNGDRVSALANVSLLGTGERALIHMTAVDISDRKRAEEQIEFHAYHDALTQLPNRRLFLERLELSLLTAKRTRGNVAVLFVDLDRFKSINDTLGHGVADQLLIEISHRLRSCVRQTDTVARHGGDEFTIILPDLHHPDDAARVAEKILSRVVEPVAVGETAIELSVSIGVAVCPYDGTDSDTLLRNADDAMYRAKRAGRNGYQLCTEQMKTRAMERLSMQSRLRKALDDGEFALAYQPIVSISTGQMAGAEALLRWNHPERGIVEAEEFLPVAEDTGLIVELGELALSSACRQLRKWRDEGLSPLRVAVNVSNRQLQQRNLAAVVRSAVEESEIDPALLELEIPESALTRDVEATTELLNLLREIGVSLNLDHFGSGFSSLRHLQVLPAHAVKFDARVLGQQTSKSADAAIIAAVVDISRKLNLRTCAEGVGSAEQCRFLQSIHCQEGQGPFFSEAIEPEALGMMMRRAQRLPVDG